MCHGLVTLPGVLSRWFGNILILHPELCILEFEETPFVVAAAFSMGLEISYLRDPRLQLVSL